MLVLTRKINERIVINGDIVIEVLEVVGNRVRLGIQAPSGVTILREELLAREKEAGSGPAATGPLAAVS
jgi:carbon storage regulator